MQLFSIENLSLAAEATAVLLLLAFAWPERKASAELKHTSLEPTNWEPAKNFYLQACLYRGLYLRQCNQTSSSHTPFEFIASADDQSKPSIPDPWRDRLTKCVNRNGLDSILNNWLSIEANHREGSCLSMVTLHQFAELVTAQGAMVTELALQAIARQLTADVGHTAIVSRYLPDRFVILHLASCLSACHKTMQSSQHCIADPAFFTVAGQPFFLSCLISIIPLEGDSNASSRLDELDEGCMEAEQGGHKIVAKVDGHWTDSVVGDDPANVDMDANTASESPQVSKPGEQNSSQELESGQNNSLQKAAGSPASKEKSEGNHSQGSDTGEGSASDISAVANPDDVAALFAQINSNKSTQSAESGKAVDPTEATATDDIASLFASVKPNSSSPTEKATPAIGEQPKPVETLTVTDNPRDTASADDISALFASVKSTSAQSTSDESKPTQQTDAKKVVVDVNEVANEDDIATLFATVGSAVKPNAAETLAQQNEATASIAAVSIAAVMPPEELASNASLDDIESLFAAMKK